MKLAAAMVVLGISAVAACAQVAPAVPGSTGVNAVAGGGSTPIDFFRQLLAAPAMVREALLATRPAAERAVLLAKVREYEALPPAERELRLNATQMRWHVKVLLATEAPRRREYLAGLPPVERAVLERRLKDLELLPARLQNEVQQSRTVIHYISRPEPTGPAMPTMPVAHRPAMATSAARDPRRVTVEQFRRFFELSERERARALERLSDSERRSLEQLMQDLDSLPPSVRTMCMDALQKFATLAPAEQAEFLKSARRWQGMAPAERETWRDFVNEMPPLPPGFGEPPLPPGLEPGDGQSSAPPLPPLPK